MKGLAGRWIGYHALAYAAASLAHCCIWSFVVHLGNPWDYMSSRTAWLLSWGISGVFMASAQLLALQGVDFPVLRMRWGLATVAGWALSTVASSSRYAPMSS